MPNVCTSQTARKNKGNAQVYNVQYFFSLIYRRNCTDRSGNSIKKFHSRWSFDIVRYSEGKREYWYGLQTVPLTNPFLGQDLEAGIKWDTSSPTASTWEQSCVVWSSLYSILVGRQWDFKMSEKKLTAPSCSQGLASEGCGGLPSRLGNDIKSWGPTAGPTCSKMSKIVGLCQGFPSKWICWNRMNYPLLIQFKWNHVASAKSLGLAAFLWGWWLHGQVHMRDLGNWSDGTWNG